MSKKKYYIDNNLMDADCFGKDALHEAFEDYMKKRKRRADKEVADRTVKDYLQLLAEEG